MAYFAEQVKTSGGLAITGSSASVTQETDRSTGVTINALCGSITTHNANLAPETGVTFTVTNPSVSIGDVVAVCIRSGRTVTPTAVFVGDVANGSFAISVVNNEPAGGSDETGAIVINFAVIKGI